MQLQQRVLTTFKQNYPDLTYDEISKLTGIQKSRVFRIFNGSELKVSEFETFESMNSKGNTYKSNEFLEMAQQCLKTLNSNHLNKIFLEMQYTLTSTLLCH